MCAEKYDPGSADPFRRPCVRPRAGEQPLALPLLDREIRVPGRGQRPAVLERVRERGE